MFVLCVKLNVYFNCSKYRVVCIVLPHVCCEGVSVGGGVQFSPSLFWLFSFALSLALARRPAT